MGYTTTFKGVLKFNSEPTVAQLRALKEMIGEDAREHPDWGDVPKSKYGGTAFSYIDLDLTDALDGLQWSGAEKSYEMVEQVNFVIGRMRKQWPEFGVSGELQAQGEESEDAWTLAIENGKAVKKPRALVGVRVQCPECDHYFRVNADGSTVK